MLVQGVQTIPPNGTGALSGGEAEAIRQTGLPVVIFGAGLVGEVLLRACLKAGVTVACFCDNNTNKTKTPLHGVRVIHTTELKQHHPDALLLISAADIQDAVEQLHGLGYEHWCGAAGLLRDFDFSQQGFSAPQDFVEYAVNTCLLCQQSYLEPDKLFLRSVDVIITERCSLKCRDCSNLMQYYQQPADCNTGDLLRSIDAFCRVVDEINEFRVIGGEPFMNRNFHEVIERLTQEPKTRRVVLYTNGTIVPRAEGMVSLRHPKILVFVTDYGSLSRNLKQLNHALRDNGVNFYARPAQGWSECAEISRRHRSAEQLQELFRNCCARNTVTLSNGRLYRCPFAANAARLAAVPDFEGDSVDLMETAPEAVATLKRRIRALLWEKAYLETCDYCAGRPFDAPEIAPAVQIRRPLAYQRYR